jgi:hypothetical protein
MRVGLWYDAANQYIYQDYPVWETKGDALPAILKLQIRNQNRNEFVRLGGTVEIFLCPIRERVSCFTLALELVPEYDR